MIVIHGFCRKKGLLALFRIILKPFLKETNSTVKVEASRLKVNLDNRRIFSVFTVY